MLKCLVVFVELLRCVLGIDARSMTAVVGANGAGKSSLLDGLIGRSRLTSTAGLAPPGFTIDDHDLTLYGQCGECNARKSGRQRRRSAA